MGNFFQQNPIKEYDKTLIKFLKTKDIEQVSQLYEKIQEDYLGAFTLSSDEFQDVFANFFENRLEDFFILLQNHHDKNGAVDIFESFAVAVIFSGNQFEDKCQFIYNMFDFDKSGKIEKKELVMIFQSFIRALCKLVNLPIPDIKVLETYASNLFNAIDQNEDYVLCYQELIGWLKNNYDLQDFLLKYAKIQTYENAARRYDEQIKIFLDKWKEVGQEEYSLETNQVIDMLENLVQGEDKEYLLKLLQDSSSSYCQSEDNMICCEVYFEVMSAYSAFLATDINYDKKLSLKELRYLIYAYEQRKESDEKLKQLLTDLDKDGSQEISLQEWIKFLSVEEGATIFKGELRREFRKTDVDNNGYLDKEEIKLMVKRVLGKRNKQLNIEKLSFKIFDQLDLNEDNKISWDEFKEIKYEDWVHQNE